MREHWPEPDILHGTAGEWIIYAYRPRAAEYGHWISGARSRSRTAREERAWFYRERSRQRKRALGAEAGEGTP